MTTAEELIIEMMPFSEEIKRYCKKYPSFFNALKVINFNRFITLQVVMITHSPNYPQDEVIGVYVYDYMSKTPRFKQDFIVNVGGKGEEFVLYTGLSSAVDGKRVKHINDFFEKYGKNGYYENTHWQDLEQLPEQFRERAKKAIALGEKRKIAGNPNIPQERIEEIIKKWNSVDGVDLIS